MLLGKFSHFKHCLFIYPLDKYLSNDYYVPGAVLGPGQVTICAHMHFTVYTGNSEQTDVVTHRTVMYRGKFSAEHKHGATRGIMEKAAALAYATNTNWMIKEIT